MTNKADGITQGVINHARTAFAMGRRITNGESGLTMDMQLVPSEDPLGPEFMVRIPTGKRTYRTFKIKVSEV